MWAALTTHQAHLAVGGQLARRYPADLAPIGAVERCGPEALDELATLVPGGGWISMPSTVDGLVPLIRPPLALKFSKTLVQMVCTRRVEIEPVNVLVSELSQSDSPDMVALAALTHPGPFTSRTYTFGFYVGIRVNGVLAAMGGQRMHVPGYREISAIATHPDFRGRGYARAIVARVVAATFDQGLTPFLHAEEANLGALALYAGLGFVERARLPLVVLEKPSA